MQAEPEILFDRKGAAGIVTLNRPAALNAITHNMVRLLAATLDAWKNDDAVTRIVIRANGRAFSAGGDLREVTEWGRAGRYADALVFWREEYLLNAAIKRYPKPYVALVDGIAMGGGVGVSVHGSHRVAGDRFQFAMPEVGIGFFPDIGATWFLPRFKGETGTYCALTGERLRAADGVAAGAATHRVRSERFPDLVEALCGDISVDATLAAFAEPAGEGEVIAKRPLIDRLFAGGSIEEILASLDGAAKAGGGDAEWAAKLAATVRSKSPTSLRIALEQVRRGKNWTFEECMRAEFRIVSRIIREPDFYEGVRAVIIDKDDSPRWKPAALSEVSPAMVEAHFAPLSEELPL
ncbi:MAG TPA: enoyl-CoA hydratase/isomerase family protein [Xanthobacteraceae bacterium]|nr:enoyl-CoA hydratase/isomerase family protein [Xanthobacteraceae bacterium]